MNWMFASIDMTAPGRLAPAEFIIPLAVITLLLIWGHMRSIARAPMPASRRRIRSMNGLLLLMLPPLMTYALTIASPQRPTVFVFAWCAVAALLALIVFLALLDAANTLRLHRRALRELRRQAIDLHRSVLSARLEPASSGTLGRDVAPRTHPLR
jgi:hypothetical protein